MNIKFLIAVMISYLFFVNAVIAAPRSSTSKEMQYALNQAVRSLQNTEDFYTSIQGDYTNLVRNLEKCRAEYNVLYTISTNGTVGGKEAGTCLLKAMIVMQERELTLINLQDAVKSGAARNYGDKEKYMRIATEYLKKATESRQKFKRDYGY